jgi:hypothetical protein
MIDVIPEVVTNEVENNNEMEIGHVQNVVITTFRGEKNVIDVKHHVHLVTVVEIAEVDSAVTIGVEIDVEDIAEETEMEAVDHNAVMTEAETGADMVETVVEDIVEEIEMVIEDHNVVMTEAETGADMVEGTEMGTVGHNVVMTEVVTVVVETGMVAVVHNVVMTEAETGAVETEMGIADHNVVMTEAEIAEVETIIAKAILENLGEILTRKRVDGDRRVAKMAVEASQGTLSVKAEI